MGVRIIYVLSVVALGHFAALSEEATYDAVKAYIEAGEYEEATRALAELVAADPGNADLRNDYGTILFRTGDVEGARAQFEKALELDPTHSSAINNLGYLYMIAYDDPEKALTYYRAAARLEYDETVLTDLQTVYAELGDLTGAIKEFEELAQLWPESARIKNDLGAFYLMEDDTANAKKYLKEAIVLDPEYYSPVVNLARAEIKEGNYDKAKTLLVPLVESGESRGTTLWDAWVYLFIAQGDGQGALDAARSATEKEPGAGTYNVLAWVYHILNDHKGAVDAAIRSLSYGETASARYIKGYSGLLGGFDASVAQAELERALELDPYDPDAWFALGEVRYKLRLYNEAREAYENAFELNPSDAGTYASAGISCFMAGDKEKAKEILNDAVKRFPGNANANHGVAVVLLDEGNYEEATAYAEKAARLAAEGGGTLYGDCLNTLSYLYAELGRFEEAYAALTDASKILDRESFVFLNLGIAAYRTGRFKDAAYAFGKSIELAEPAAAELTDYATTTGQGYAGRAASRAKTGDFEGALADAEEAEKYLGEHSIILFARALAADAAGDAAGRDALLLRVIEINEELMAGGEKPGIMSEPVYREAVKMLNK